MHEVDRVGGVRGLVEDAVAAQLRRGGIVKLWEPLTKTVFYAIIATLVVAPLALGDRGRYPRLLSSRPIV